MKLTKKNPNFRMSLEQLPKTKPQDLVRLIESNAGYMMDVGLQQLYSSNRSVDDVFAHLADRLRSRAKLIDEVYRKHYE